MRGRCLQDAQRWGQRHDLNVRPSGYEPDELPGCSTLTRDQERSYDNLVDMTRGGASAGGRATAKIQREQALSQYQLNPSRCRLCGCVLEIGTKKVSSVRKQRYCSRACAADALRAVILPEKPRTNRSSSDLLTTTKAELFSSRKNWQSARSTIQKLARRVYRLARLPQACVVCGYRLHVEVAHRKAVSTFPGDSTLAEINHVDNLVALCPNHHWELDHELLTL